MVLHFGELMSAYPWGKRNGPSRCLGLAMRNHLSILINQFFKDNTKQQGIADVKSSWRLPKKLRIIIIALLMMAL
jgi:hypothetical protein